MMYPDGSAVCDRCGQNVGNAGVNQCLVAAAITLSGLPIQLHMCYRCVGLIFSMDDTWFRQRVNPITDPNWPTPAPIPVVISPINPDPHPEQ